ncbi:MULTISPECIES: autotransporter domain-containing protein [Bradyrhizobium]|uniref:Autotransporter domain-containing protein n=1 Tax=Bradyrhizobium elkanii TaxID=29448 RepID=A0A4U6SD04_BRAEL|nr:MULTISPECIES: autotransporter domain-containing protein [Bradyrhizobium]MTV13671.1 autotransporter domain-containing protein [Bradyrhizobium sp. BR2003]TKV82726.1 autotransporter domain-containing protein [Bradyrhizobium elkanii]
MALALCALTTAIASPTGSARAQSYTWGGTGSSGATPDYNLATNWSNPPVGAPPVNNGQGAIFDATGSATVDVTSAVTPYLWTFTANSQSYVVSGADINFGSAAWGIFNFANSNQTISISNNIGETTPVAQVQQLGASTLVLSGHNSYSGGTLISAGTVQVTNADSVGTGTIKLNGGTFQMQSATVSSVAFSNSIAVNAAGGTVDANGAQVNLQGVIADGAGAGVLRLIDSSASGFSNVQLSGANTYSGGTLVVDTTVVVGNNNSVGSGTVTLDNASFQADGLGNLTFANNFKINTSAIGSAIDANGVTLTIAGNIADGNGPGKLTVLDNSGGLGRVVLTGTNTYTGGTTICDCATLQLGDASHIASIVGEVAVDGKFDIVNANTAGITKIVNDGFNGIATTAFYNSTTASTATIVNQNFGITEFRDSSTAGNATVSNTNGALTIFRDTSSAGNAKFDNSNGGTLVFGDALGPPGGLDASTAGKAVIHNHDGAGTVFLGHTNAGQAKITNGDNGGGSLFFEFSSAASSTITTTATGFTNFYQNSTAANATIDNSGLTYFGTSGLSLTEAPTAGNATITNRSGGTLVFDVYATAGNATITTESGASVTFLGNSTGGTAQFITQGTGYVDFGGSLGPNGDGRITAGSIAGSGAYYIGGGNTLVVGGNNLSTVVSGVIADSDPCGCGPTGPANFEKTGSGTLTLSGVNSYTGTTTVNGGILQVDGSIASSSLTTVNAGGALSGVGTVGNTTIASGGILLPGNATPGTFLNVAGNLAFQSGALYLVALSSTASTFAKVTGTATLAGSVGVSVAAGSTIAKQYTILSAAGGRSGTFAGVDSTGLPSNLVATLGYDASNAYLNFTLDYGAKSKLNVNQQNVATTLQNFFNANGGINAVFAGLSPNGLTQASGEGATGSQQATFNAMGLFLGLLTDPFVAGRDGGFGGGAGTTPFTEESTPLAYAARKTEPRDALAAIHTKAPPLQPSFEQRWSVWVAGYGGSQTTSGNAVLGSNNTSSSLYGTAVGADYRLSPNTIAGFALAGGATSFSVNGLGWGRSDLFQAGAFVRHSVGAAYLSAALAYGWQDVTTDRIVTAAGADHLRANFNANAWSGRLEGGYRHATPWIGLTPYAAAQFTSFELPAYAESMVSGGGAFALNYAAKSVTDVRSELGLRSDKSFAVDGGIFTLRGRVAWAHDFNPDRAVGAVFQTLPGAAFVVNGAAQASDSVLTTASAELRWRNGWSAAATFEGEFSNVTQSFAGKGVMRYTW